MSAEEPSAILNRVGVIRQACDLDLLLFFRRHPCVLLTAEQLVHSLGYERGRVASSLERLIEAGLVTRSQNPAHTARLYVLQPDALPGGLLRSLLDLGATRRGRQDLMRLLQCGPGHNAVAPLGRSASITRIK